MNYREKVLHFYGERRREGHRPGQALCIAKHDAKYKEDYKAKIHSNKLDMMPSHHAAYAGEETTALPNGWKIKVEFCYDTDTGPPWKECDGHGVVYEARSREEYMDDWLLNDDRGWYRYYDWKASLKLAIKDGWGCKPYDISSAMDAVKADYEFLRRWCNDDWWYVGMIVTLLDEDDTELREDSVWGFDSDSIDYLCSEARSWAARMIRDERDERRAEARHTKINARFADAMECGV
jgi:hypothetical protein